MTDPQIFEDAFSYANFKYNKKEIREAAERIGKDTLIKYLQENVRRTINRICKEGNNG